MNASNHRNQLHTYIIMEPQGTIAFATIGVVDYGFDIFSVNIPSPLPQNVIEMTQHLLTDSVSINHNGQFIDEQESVVYISERTGSPRIFLSRYGNPNPELLPTPPESLFHDRPSLQNGRLIFVSAHEEPDTTLKSWTAVYSTQTDTQKTTRLTPYGDVDYSPAVSQSGNFVAVASYGSRPWKEEIQELDTDIVVFSLSDPAQRRVLCNRGGWPTWSGDCTIYFHRKADDGWWSIFCIDLPELFKQSDCEGAQSLLTPRRVTPPGLHAFTPSASHNGKHIAIATRRRENKFRHIELFDLKSNTFHKFTELLNPNFHHYNPFFSPESTFLGYHRFRGEGKDDSMIIPHVEHIASSFKQLRMLRINGNFPSFSARGDFIAVNPGFGGGVCGINIVRSDGSKKWTLVKDRIAFHTSWSNTEDGVLYASLGPIFRSIGTTVQIARVSFDPMHLKDDYREEIPARIKILTREDTGNNAFPSCSPDGKHIVFRSGRSGHKNLYVMDAVNGETNGGEIRQLTEGKCIDTMPNWSPDGNLIAFSSNRHNPDDVEHFSIYFIRPDGSELRRIYVAEHDNVDKERINHVYFSPDGQWLLFTANLSGITAEPVSMPNQYQPYGDLYISRLDGSDLRRITWSGYENGTQSWHDGGDFGMGSLSLDIKKVGDKLKGEFEEQLWIICEI